MTVEMDAALAGALVGAVLGMLGAYVIDLRKAERHRQDRDRERERDRRRQRASIATALLQDCRRLEFELREVYGEERPSQIALTRPSLFYDALRSVVGSLAPESVQPVAEFFRRVDHLYAAVKLLRDLGGGQIKSTPQREYEIRSHAAFVLQTLPGAFGALRNEGGIVPGPLGWNSTTFPALPAIPAPIFDDAIIRSQQKE